MPKAAQHRSLGSLLRRPQTLPFPLLEPILSVVRDLRSSFGVSFLLGSATQPTFEQCASLPSGFRLGELRPLLDEPKRVFQALRRARVQMPFLDGTRWTWGDLALRLEDVPNALIIVNARARPRAFQSPQGDGTEVPSTYRARCVQRIAKWSWEGRTTHVLAASITAASSGGGCIVVSTQVVEAGVHVDFPVVLPASPLDAIIQAAGRCDREGLLTLSTGHPAGRVVVFEPAGDHSTPPGYYAEATDQTRQILGELATEPHRVIDYQGRVSTLPRDARGLERKPRDWRSDPAISRGAPL